MSFGVGKLLTIINIFYLFNQNCIELENSTLSSRFIESKQANFTLKKKEMI